MPVSSPLPSPAPISPASGFAPYMVWAPAMITFSLGVPAIAFRLTGTHLEPEMAVLVFGLGILSAAFLLGASAEAAQHDIPASLSLALLAFVAVLPEYAIDLLFAWRAADDPEQAQFAVANMTGSNRLLLGVGWSAVLMLYVVRNKWFLNRPERVLVLPRTISLEFTALVAATIVAFIIPVVGNISLVMSGVLLVIFVWYLFRTAQHPMEEPEVGGPAEMVTRLPRWRRRIVVTLFFIYSGAVIVASAEPFADGLIALGGELGIDEFLLVQWIAPFASESPEFLAALYLVWRGAARQGMTTLISSKVNQFTLLIASLPIAYAISGGNFDPLPMDARQQEEVFLTAAQSLFGILLIMNKRLSIQGAATLLVLFLGQFIFTDTEVRIGFAIVYLVLAAVLLLREYRLVPGVIREAFSNAEMEAAPEPNPSQP